VWNFSEGDSLEIAKEINVVLSLKLETELETEEKANNQKENDKKENDNQPVQRTKRQRVLLLIVKERKRQWERQQQQEIVCTDPKCRYRKFDKRKGGTHAHAKLSIANGAVGFVSLKIGPYRDGTKKPPSSLRRKGPNIVLGVEQTQKKLTFTGGLDSDVPIKLARIAEAQIEQRFQPKQPGADKVPLKPLNDRVYAVVLDDEVNQGKTCSFIRERNMHDRWWAATLSRPLYLLQYFLMKIKKTKFKTTLKLDCNIAGIF
jgi:hypothetical protein